MTVDGMLFCYIPPGPFWMGSSGDDSLTQKDEGRLRQVDLPYGYGLGQYPVTQAQFRAFVAAGGYGEERYWGEAKERGYWQNGRFKARYDNSFRDGPYEFSEPFSLPNHPVVGISWYECLAFTRWPTERWWKTGWLANGWTVRLPSEAEWEKAARGGVKLPGSLSRMEVTNFKTAVTLLQDNPHPQRRFPGGHTPPEDVVWSGMYNDKTADIDNTSAVGMFPTDSSPYGAREMGGNVNEWVQSLYQNKPYLVGDGREKIDASDDPRSIRGGAWYDEEKWLRCASRDWNPPDFWSYYIGFRIVASPFPSGL